MSIFYELGVCEGKDRIKEEALYNLVACYTIIERKISNVLAPHVLNPVKMNVLLMLKHVGKKRGLSLAEIKKRVIVPAMSIPQVVNQLENEKLVRVSQGGRKEAIIKITKNGARLLSKIWPLYREEVKNIMSLIPSIDIIAGTVVLSGMREAFHSQTECCNQETNLRRSDD